MEKQMIFRQDFPDPDVIRVEDCYYMVTTTMHFMPGATILKSYDLVHWEIASHVYEKLEDLPAHHLEEGANIYGKGMWAPTFRYHKGQFYICFSANDTKKTYLFRAESIEGPWKVSTIEGFYHDSSLLFDDDDSVYIVYGNRQIYLTELDKDLKGPKPNGRHRMIIEDKGNVILGYEGTHIYKINGYYYVFMIHWLADGTKRRVEACYRSSSIDGTFKGKDVFDDDLGYCNMGVAQGGIVDTPEGHWFSIMFQDSGAVGRVPVLVPVTFEDGFPVFGVNKKMPEEIAHLPKGRDYTYEPLFISDTFDYEPDAEGRYQLKPQWQWNHNPDMEAIRIEDHALMITSESIVSNITQAKNCLTQRCIYPLTEAEVTIDGTALNNGDYTGLTAFQGRYSFVGLTKDEDNYYVTVIGKEAGTDTAYVYAKVPFAGSQVRLRLRGDFEKMKDVLSYAFFDGDQWQELASDIKHQFTLDHFTGCRVGLFMYSTKTVGGMSKFSDFKLMDTFTEETI